MSKMHLMLKKGGWMRGYKKIQHLLNAHGYKAGKERLYLGIKLGHPL